MSAGSAGCRASGAERMTGSDVNERSGGTAKWIKRLVPPAILAALFVVFFTTGLHEYAKFENLKNHYGDLQAFVAGNYLAAIGLYILAYALIAAASLPIASLVTLVGGFLFSWHLGTLYTVIGATIGATALFLTAKTSFGEPLRARVKPYIGRMEEGFRENEFNYLMFLRLLPVFPFFVVNLVPAFLGVSTRMFVITTFIGIIPGTAVYCIIGSGLGNILEKGEEFSIENAVSIEIVLGLAGLAILALAPVVWRKIKGRSKEKAGAA